jgi:hypothetical protein
MTHFMSLLLASTLALLATPSEAAQQPPCLSPFQRVATFAPAPHPEQLMRVEVDGDVALALSFRGAAQTRYFVHVFEQLPAPTGWVATQTFELQGLDYGGGTEPRFRLDGGRAIVARNWQFRDVLVLEPDPLTGRWGPVFAIPFPLPASVTRVELSGDRIAVGLQEPMRIQIWRRAPNGTYLLEDEIWPLTTPAYGFATEFDFDGDRLVQNDRATLDVFTPDANGNWSLEQASAPGPQYWLAGWVEPPFVEGERGAHLLQGQPSGGINGLALGFWRFSTGLQPARGIFDGAVHEAQLGNVFGYSDDAVFNFGTFIDILRNPTCGTPDPIYLPIAVLGTGDRDVPVELGQICNLAGFAGAGNVRDFSYDGRTLAFAVPRELGAPPNNVHFASLIGADLDRNANCVEDAVEIAAAPALDGNSNARIDANEERGASTCLPPTPNSSGRLGTLAVIGTEFAGSQDLFARADDLPANAPCVLVVARDSSTAPPAGPFGLCLGSGAGSSIGRYTATSTDAAGTTLVALRTDLLPGSIVVLPGETWSWQLIYRDSGNVRSTEAVHVLLH